MYTDQKIGLDTNFDKVFYNFSIFHELRAGNGPTTANLADLPSDDRTCPKLGGGDGGVTWSILLSRIEARTGGPGAVVSDEIELSSSSRIEHPDLPVARIGYFSRGPSSGS